MNDPGNPQSRLGFDIGGDPGFVCFDNILLRKGEAISTPSSLTRTPAQLSTSLSNYPNPFQGETAFYYTLQQPAQVSLKILSLTGQEVETVESGFRQKGEHVVTRKLLLQIHHKP